MKLEMMTGDMAKFYVGAVVNIDGHLFVVEHTWPNIGLMAIRPFGLFDRAWRWVKRFWRETRKWWAR